MTPDDATLVWLANDFESDRVERKETWSGDAADQGYQAACPLGEIHRPSVEEYLQLAFAPDVLEANERTYPERLSACRLIVSPEEPVATVLGILCCGKSPRNWLPGAYIQFLRLDGSELTDPILDSAELDGTLPQQLARLDDKLRGHLTTSVDFKSADQEIRSTSYPLVALQQLARNAVMHRTYEHTHAPIRLYWYADRIEIHSPGGPFGQVTAAKFGQPGVTDYRNPHVAEAMRVLGFVQRFGVGIASAQRELQKSGHPPAEFQVEDNFVLATVRARR